MVMLVRGDGDHGDVVVAGRGSEGSSGGTQVEKQEQNEHTPERSGCELYSVFLEQSNFPVEWKGVSLPLSDSDSLPVTVTKLPL